MTTKEIARLCGNTERAVQLWSKKAGEKISSVGEKISSAGHGKAADFTVEETIEIIRAGGNNTLADLLMENAKSKDALIISKTEKSVEIEEIKKAQCVIMERLNNLESKQIETVKQIENKSETKQRAKITKSYSKADGRFNYHKVSIGGQKLMILTNYCNEKQYNVAYDSESDNPPVLKMGFLSVKNALKWIERTF